jgi:hypothetical protein
MLVNILTSIFFFAVDFFVLALAGIIRLMPTLFRSGRVILNQFMDLSYQFYRFVLGNVAPFLRERWGFNILVGALRVVATVILSLVLGLLFLLVFGLPFNVWTVGLCILHGLAVGLVWGGAEAVSEGFRMGVNAE